MAEHQVTESEELTGELRIYRGQEWEVAHRKSMPIDETSA
jgi:hypothetical protein